MNKLFFCALGAAFVLNSASAFAAPVGHVIDLEGSATDTRGGKAAALKTGAAIEKGDVIETGEKSRVRIDFIDDTQLTVAEKGKLAINEFVFDPNNKQGNKADLDILHTAFSYVGGLMDKGDKPDVNLHLDFGSIGIRGTQIFRAMHNGECWIYIEHGRVDVSNKGGAVHLKSGEGTIMSAQEKAPAAAHIWSDKDIDWIKSQVVDPRLHKDWK
jgi:hypothetical protein